MTRLSSGNACGSASSKIISLGRQSRLPIRTAISSRVPQTFKLYLEATISPDLTLDPSYTIANENGTCFGTVGQRDDGRPSSDAQHLIRTLFVQVSCYEAQHVVLLQRHSTGRLWPGLRLRCNSG